MTIMNNIRWKVISIITKLLIILSLILNLSSAQENPQSTCYGTYYAGSLENGVKLPYSGKNFKSYSFIRMYLDRTSVHSAVYDIIINSYQNIYAINPEFRYKYGETGSKNGGRFKHHRSHQNGLSVDFMVPIRSLKGYVKYLPTNALNRYGYGIDLDAEGYHKDYKIDFNAIALHLVELHKEATRLGYGIKEVIIAEEYKKFLYETEYGDFIQQHIVWYSGGGPAVRHDDHYHVNFSVPCAQKK